jgi:hypothetical protein
MFPGIHAFLMSGTAADMPASSPMGRASCNVSSRSLGTDWTTMTNPGIAKMKSPKFIPLSEQ